MLLDLRTGADLCSLHCGMTVMRGELNQTLMYSSETPCVEIVYVLSWAMLRVASVFRPVVK